ncbi:alpha beta-propellor repeat-containing integrin [Streptomyces malaysiensis subsp. malaysiensis]|nr:alpha beta-propellor repeat-containing integrin [Streptomyces malaysiensis]
MSMCRCLHQQAGYPVESRSPWAPSRLVRLSPLCPEPAASHRGTAIAADHSCPGPHPASSPRAHPGNQIRPQATQPTRPTPGARPATEADWRPARSATRQPPPGSRDQPMATYRPAAARGLTATSQPVGHGRPVATRGPMARDRPVAGANRRPGATP